MNLEIPAEFYEQVKPYLRAGDYMLAVASRDDGAENPVTGNRVRSAIAQLQAFTDSRIRKVLVFSANDDLDTWLASIPSDVEIISYNAEASLSPDSEVGSPAALQTAGIAFANTVNNSGRQSHFAPTSSVYNTLQNQDRLATILGSMRGAVFQGQTYLGTITESAFLTEMRDRADYVHAAGSGLRFGIQLSAAQQTADQISRILKDLWVAADFGTILASSASDDSVLIQALKELRPLASGHRPPRRRNAGGLLSSFIGRLKAFIGLPELIWTIKKVQPQELIFRAAINKPQCIADLKSSAALKLLPSHHRSVFTRFESRMLSRREARIFQDQQDFAAILLELEV